MGIVAREPRVRVAALILRDDSLLMVKHQKMGQSYWMLPGGGVDYGESLPVALQRELREELCIETEIGALRFVNDSIAPDGERHVINVHFDARILSGAPQLGEDDRIVDWGFQPLSRLSSLPIRPAYGDPLLQLLQTAPPSPPTYLGSIWQDQ